MSAHRTERRRVPLPFVARLQGVRPGYCLCRAVGGSGIISLIITVLVMKRCDDVAATEGRTGRAPRCTAPAAGDPHEATHMAFLDR